MLDKKSANCLPNQLIFCYFTTLLDFMTTVNITDYNFLETLKAETSEAHQQLEQLQISRAIVSPEITNQQYFTYLSKMLSVNKAIESQVFPMVESVFPDIDQRYKSKWLEADLVHDDGNVEASGEFTFQAQLTLGMAVGIIYVIEGSTLGGRYILQNISANLDFDADHGASYFAGYGNKSGAFWKSVLNNLQEFEKKNDGDEIIKGANIAFSSIYKFLSE